MSTNALRTYGIREHDANAALMHDVRSRLPTQRFFMDAMNLLQGIGEVVMSEVIPDLESVAGRWHPSGFMVYPLGSHDQLGILRLHIWPRGLRRRLTKGRGRLGEIFDGDIHNHAWNIASLVLAYYSDNFYEVRPIPPESADHSMPNVFRVFRVTYQDGGQQALTS